MRAAEAARTLARWEGGTPPPRRRRLAVMAEGAASREPHHRHRQARPRAGAACVEASYSRPFLTYGSIGPSCALAECEGRHAQGLVAQPGPAVLRDWLARALGLDAAQVTVLPPPGRRRLRPQHRRRRRVRRVVHGDAPPGPRRAGAMVARGRIRRRADQHRDGDQAVAPCSTPTTSPREWTIEIWSPPHAQRPGMNGNSNLHRRRRAAQRAAAQPARTTCRTSAAAAPPATRSRSTTCRATG